MIITTITVVLCASLIVTAAKSGEFRLSSQPAHEIICEWKNTLERRQSPDEAEITEPLTLTSTLSEDGKGKCIIIRAKNVRPALFTEGKVIYSADGNERDYSGEHIYIIPADDIQKSKRITLRLTPVKSKTGAVTAPVYFTSNNDYLYTLLQREKAVIAAVFVLFEVCVICAVLLCFLKRRARLIYIMLFALCTALITLCKSDLNQFIFASGSAVSTLLVTACIILFATLFGFALTFIKRQNKKPLKQRLLETCLFRFNL